MTHSPNTQIQAATREFLQTEFDKPEWQARLHPPAPALRFLNKAPTPPSQNFPAGTVTMYFEMVDSEGTITIALLAKFIAPGQIICGGREWHPQALMIDGVFHFL
jgi:hypothetical protein